MKLCCSKCGAVISPEDVNIATDLAKCVACNEIFKASDLAAAIDFDDALKPLPESNIRLDRRSHTLNIVVPADGITKDIVPAILFAVVWVSFIGFWTIGAASSGGAFALFSLPFWAVGIGMAIGIINAVTEEHQIRIDRDHLRVIKKSLLKTKQTEIRIRTITRIAVDRVVPRNPLTAMTYLKYNSNPNYLYGGIPLPTIEGLDLKLTIANLRSEREKKWIVALLQATIYKHTNRRV